MKVSEGNWYLRREYRRAQPDLMEAYRRLSLDDRAVIDALVMVLCDKLNGLGPASALELLSKLGTFIARGGKR